MRFRWVITPQVYLRGVTYVSHLVQRKRREFLTTNYTCDLARLWFCVRQCRARFHLPNLSKNAFEKMPRRPPCTDQTSRLPDNPEWFCRAAGKRLRGGAPLEAQALRAMLLLRARESPSTDAAKALYQTQAAALRAS